MKKWIDASLIAEFAEVEREKWEFEKLMKEKPNFNKNKSLNKKNKKKGVKGCFKNGNKKTIKSNKK